MLVAKRIQTKVRQWTHSTRARKDMGKLLCWFFKSLRSFSAAFFHISSFYAVLLLMCLPSGCQWNIFARQSFFLRWLDVVFFLFLSSSSSLSTTKERHDSAHDAKSGEPPRRWRSECVTRAETMKAEVECEISSTRETPRRRRDFFDSKADTNCTEKRWLTCNITYCTKH